VKKSPLIAGFVKFQRHAGFVGRQHAVEPTGHWLLKHPVGLVVLPPEQLLTNTASAPVFVHDQSFVPSQNELPGVQMGAPIEPSGA